MTISASGAFGGDDLAPLFAPPPHPSAHPMSYRQGVVLEWNPATLANRVRIGGAGGPEFTNLPVLGVAEAASLRPGSVVGIMVVADPNRGAATYAILGRLVTPGSAEATDAITGLSQKIYSQTIGTQEGTSSTSYTNLATVGPAVTVPVGASGRVLVELSFGLQWTADSPVGGSATVELSGANTISADDVAGTENFYARTWVSLTAGTATMQTTPSAAKVFDGLTPGATTVTVKYKSIEGGTPNADFARRTLTVIAL